MIRNMIYAILLGAGMAACLSQQENDEETQAETMQQEENLSPTGSTTEPAPIPEPASFVIEKGRAGDVAIGMPIDELRSNVPMGFAIRDTTLMLEEQQSTAYVLTPQDQDKGLLVEQQCEAECRVWRINVLSTDFKTPQGLGIGSKYGEVKEAYPIGTVALAEDNFVAVSEEAGMSFVLDDTQLPQDAQDRGRYNPGNIPANTLVKRIILY
ncbi:mechanosensitive ion channel protein MscS [Pontibacter diazotrophicus]|uniref:Mechanosensitive ion channel protein MscS n=2 Tax=Pontibacter diazotrophicus TaxID=1400979 RepID=A0A3D8L9Y1_9BACT|nr:mechanosensitive ion channel protein MscS [Pontibacter diazotrophicus]